MENVAAQLYSWLRQNNIDPDTVKLILRTDDDRGGQYLISAAKAELRPYQLNPECEFFDLRGLKLHGIAISFSSIDRR